MAGVVAACGASSATPAGTVAPPAVTPTPTTTPDRHILGTLDSNQVFQLLAAAGLGVRQESLGGPGPKGEPTVVLYLVDGVAHVAIRQYSTAAAVAKAGFRPRSAVAIGDAPFEIWASNIVLDIGPTDTRRKPAAPDPAVASSAFDIVSMLDPFMGPLQQRAVQPLTLPSTPVPATPAPAPTTAPSPTKP